jgi:Zn-dependent protease with chaperone function
MTFVRRMLPVFCLALLLTCLIALPCFGQTAPSPPAPASAAAAAQPASAQQYSLPPGKLAQAIALGRIRAALDIGGSLWALAILWLLLATGTAAGLARWTERLLCRRWQQGLLFFAVFLVLTTLANLPLDALGHIASRSFGISVQGWAGWLGDLAKGLGLSLLFGVPLLLFFNWIVRVSPRRFWLWAWLAALPLIVFSVFASPLLDPIFNKFEPLEAHHAALVARLETVVARIGTHIPPSRMFLMKASRKSNGINAYVTGIGSTKRFVLWDTTVDRLPQDEILFIFGHESGHYVLHHIPKELCGMTASLFFVFWGCAGVSGWLVRRFGARWGLATSAGAPSFAPVAKGGNREIHRSESEPAPLASRPGFVLLLFVLSSAGLLLQPAANAFSRYFEHQADIYGQEAIHGLVANPQETVVSAFNHMGEAWLEDPNPSPIIEFWESSHPSVQQRVRFAAHYDPWANGGRGRFFAKQTGP